MYPRNLVLFVVALTLGTQLISSMEVGGLGAEKPASPEVKELVKAVKPQLNAKICEKRMAIGNALCSDNLELEPVSYKSQVVAGVNYFIKMKVAEPGSNTHEYWLARVWDQPWTKRREVTSVKGPEESKNPITYF